METSQAVPAAGAYVAKKLVAIMGEVGYIQKDKKNTQQGYTYLSEAGIKAAVQPLLVKNSVLFLIVGHESETVPTHETKAGSGQHLTKLMLRYRFIDADTGDFLEGTMPALGIDGQDKGVYKAITGAIKYILTSTFLIPTGDDAENDDGTPPAKKVAAAPRPASAPAPAARPVATAKPPAPPVAKVAACSFEGCTEGLSEAVLSFSTKKYGRGLCMTHQKTALDAAGK